MRQPSYIFISTYFNILDITAEYLDINPKFKEFEHLSVEKE